MIDYVKMAIGNMTHRKTRSWLTLIGIFIGITAVVALISLGQGLQYALTAEFLELGADKMQITANSPTFGAGDDLDSTLRDRDLRVIERTPGVLRVATYQQRSSRITWGRDNVAFYPISGINTDPDLLKLSQDYMTFKIGQGRSIKQGDTYKALLGYELTNPDNLENPMKVGDKIVVNGTQFEVVGVYEKMGDPMADSSISIPSETFESVFDVNGLYDAFVVQVNPGADPEVVAEEITENLRRSRNLKEGDENFDVSTPRDLVESFNQIFNIVQFVIVGIAGISLLVGGIGIMNTMYTAVLERTKEIGIMKAIGATNKAILMLFLIESGLLGLVGGIIGLTTGLGLAKATEYVGKVFLGTDLLYALAPWWLVFGSLAFAFTVGMLSGVLPAYRASKQKPVDSLRYE